MINNMLILFIGVIILILGGEFLVRGSSSLALKAHISPLVVGLTVVAFGTSAPELLISIKAALEGSPDMTMGNVIGSNICNLALVLGITALIEPIKVSKDSIKLDWPVTMGSSLLLFILVSVFDSVINYYEGILFILLLSTYTTYIFRKSRKKNKSKSIKINSSPDISKLSNSIAKDISFVLFGCCGLYYGANWFVNGAKDMAVLLGISERVIGITVLALGTSLPELVTSIVASFRKETDLALGNLMGSNIFNVFSILGITSLIKEINVSEKIISHDMIVMLAVTALIFPLMIHKKVMGKTAGAILLMIYFLYTFTVLS